MKKKRGKQHASRTNVDENPPQKKTKESKLYEIADELQKGYLFVYALTRTITNSSDNRLIDSGASRNIIGYRDSLRYFT